MSRVFECNGNSIGTFDAFKRPRTWNVERKCECGDFKDEWWSKFHRKESRRFESVLDFSSFLFKNDGRSVCSRLVATQ